MASAGAQPKRWRDLRKRFLSALVLGPAALACIWLGAEPWTALIAIAVAVLTWEWVHLCGLRTRVLPGLAVPVAVLAAGTLAVAEHPRVALLALAIGCGADLVDGGRGCAMPTSRARRRAGWRRACCISASPASR